MNIEDRIKAIKEKRDKQIIEKAKAESRLEQLKKEEDDIINKCKALNIDYNNLDALVKETSEKLESLITEAESIINDNNIKNKDVTTAQFPF